MREKKKKAKQDPYRWAQAQQRKNAHLRRRGEIEKARKEEWGDPVWGKTTPYLQSLDSAGQSPLSKVPVDAEGKPLETPVELPTTPGLRKHFVTDEELAEVTTHAYTLTKPMVGVVSSRMEDVNAEDEESAHAARHQKAVQALERITSMDNASAKDRFHANVKRLVDEFGRHNTDNVLKPRPESIHPNTTPMPGRAGPDTGSSEVQIAILTTRIRALAQALEINRGYKDKHNKRNLRLLVHRRQKLLKYMEKKERGSERWTNMLEKLGLTPATWKGQIEV